MNEELFCINKFNIIQDEENYYFFRALNMVDNNDLENGIIINNEGQIERIRTDRERHGEGAKYSEDDSISLEELFDHIKMNYLKETNCISITSNSNVALSYGRAFYKDKYVMVKVPKEEIGKNVVVAGQYMLKELYLKIEQAIEEIDEKQRSKILEKFKEIENAENKTQLEEIISKKYIAKKEEVTLNKAHLREKIKYGRPKIRVSSYGALNEEQKLEVNKVYAKLAVLENENILKKVLPRSSNEMLRKTIGSAFSSVELIHYGEITKQEIIEIPKEVVDIFSLIQQIDGIEKEKIEEIKTAVLTAVKSHQEITPIDIPNIQQKENISIEEMYELTEGKVEYGKANSIDKNMFYLSRARYGAIQLAQILDEILENKYRDTIQYIRENCFRIEPEIISKQNNKGVKISEAVNLNLNKEQQRLIDEIKKLSREELQEISNVGGFFIPKTLW